MKSIQLLSAIVAVVLAFAPPDIPVRPPVAVETLIPCEVESITDGDTFTANINLPWDVCLRNQPIRCLGYDAWETSKRRRSVDVTDAEIVKGMQATGELATLLRNTQHRVYLKPGKESRDNYGRILAYVRVATPDKLVKLEDYMTQRGHVRE